VKPSPARWHLWPKMREANMLLAEACEKDDRLFFVDIATPMLDESGKVRSDIFRADRLHMNRKGYQVWRRVLRAELMKREAVRERSC
jgi:lysophospholipase L1-like esterase